MAKAEQKKEIQVPERAANQLRNYVKRRKAKVDELRKQARNLAANQSAEEATGIGWLALALDVPDNWEYDDEVGCFRHPRQKTARTPGTAVGGRKV